MLNLIELAPDDGVAATGTGMALAVTPDGKLTLDHGPIPELGWPAMQMDLALSGVDPATVQLNAPIEFDLAKDDDGMFSIIAVRGEAIPENEAPREEVAPQAAAAPIVVSGTIDAIDAAAGRATITHGPISEIGMPGMTMEFAVDEALNLAALEIDREMSLTFMRPDGMTMVLSAAIPTTPPMEVSGTINAVDPAARMANVTHGPMVEIGMPGMTMDFRVADEVDIGALPVGEKRTLLLRRNPDFSMTLIGTAAARSVTQ
jgi:Cu(I)/Ag(I) efflux system membrane fusion protein